MSLKFKRIFSLQPHFGPAPALLAAAALTITSGCAKLAYELPNPDEVRKVQEAGVDAPSPSGDSPALAAVANETAQSQTAESETGKSPDVTAETSPSPVPLDSPSPAPSPSPSSSDDSGHEHASDSGKEHSDEHSAHHRSKVKVAHSYARTFAARKLTDAEIRRALTSLPYRSTREHPMETLQMSRATRGRTTPRPHVLNSQVILAIDITDLPGAERLTEVQDLRLSMVVTRVSIKNQLDTEILCLVELGRCSGRAIAARSWQSNRNDTFWSAAPANAVIRSSSFADNEPGTQVPFTKSHRMSEGRIDIPLAETLGTDILSTLRSITTDENGRKVLLVSVSDDTLVHSAELSISGTETTEVEVVVQDDGER